MKLNNYASENKLRKSLEGVKKTRNSKEYLKNTQGSLQSKSGRVIKQIKRVISRIIYQPKQKNKLNKDTITLKA
jgi:hypothetical protein